MITPFNESILNDLSVSYSNKNVLVTGGASFIGSHLVDKLISVGAKVLVIDDLSSGKIENLSKSDNKYEFRNVDLRNRNELEANFDGIETVFHLAAIHGGRGFIETRQRDILDNFNIDTNVYRSCKAQGINSVVHASSACAYPVDLQDSETQLNNLKESEANTTARGGAFPDGVYGWTKLMGEHQLEQFCDENMYGRSARIFTAYGERENLSHAAIALIGKSILKMDPFPIWGSGQQTRNFTYVDDTVTGLLLLGADKQGNNFEVFNLGTDIHIKVIDFVNIIHKLLNWAPVNWEFQLDKPTGVASRASNNEKITSRFNWAPVTSAELGISRTIDWYLTDTNMPKSVAELEAELMKR
jgi:UDP-glucose 4-epimerase